MTAPENISADKLERMKEKIALLLNKAENTPYPAEAQTFQEHAERLMVRYGIAKAQLDDTDAKRGKSHEPVIEVKYEVKGLYRIKRALGLHAIAQAFPAVTTLETSWGNSKIMFVIGHQSDVNTVLALFGSVLAQLESAVAQWWAAAPKEHLVSESMRRMERATFQFHFLLEVADRIKALYAEERSDSVGAELVFVGRQERVDDYIDQAFPNLRQGRARRVATGSQAASRAGRAAGARADMGNGRKVGQAGRSALV